MDSTNAFWFRLWKLFQRTVSLLLVLLLFVEFFPGANYAEAAWTDSSATYSVAYPSYGTVMVRNTTTIKSYPYSRDGLKKETSKVSSVDLETASPGATYQVIGLHKNNYGNYWYKVNCKTGGKTGYLYAGDSRNFTCKVEEAFTLENPTRPDNHKEGEKLTLKGTVKSSYLYIHTLSGSISDSYNHSCYKSLTFSDNRASFELKGSAIDKALKLGTLSAGDCSYIIKVSANVNYSDDGKNLKTVTKEGTLLEHKFTVKGTRKTVRFFDGNQELTQYRKNVQENNDKVTIPSLEKDGYEFVGWHAYREGGTWYTNQGWQTEEDIKSKGYTKKNYSAGDEHSLYHSSWKAGDVSFYAQWNSVITAVIKESKPTYLAVTFKKGAEIHKVPHDLGDKEQLAKLSKNTEYTVTRVCKNKWNNLWYEIDYNGKAYIWAGGGNYVSHRFLDEAVSFDLSFPDQVEQGTEATLKGRVIGETALTEVRDVFGEEIKSKEKLLAVFYSASKWKTKKETPDGTHCNVNTTLTKKETSYPTGNYFVTVAAKPQLWLTTDGKTWSDLSKGAEAQVCTWTKAFQIVERPAEKSAVTSTAEATARINEYLKKIQYDEKGGKVYWTHVDANGKGATRKNRNLENEYEELKKNARTGNYDKNVSPRACTDASLNSGCISNVFDTNARLGLSQCEGFAYYMSYVLFMDKHMWNTSGGEYWPRVDSSNIEKYEEAGFTIQPGDIIRKSSTTQHYMVVYSVAGNSVSVIEANYGGKCKINTRTIEKNEIMGWLNSPLVYEDYKVTPHMYKDKTGKATDTKVKGELKNCVFLSPLNRNYQTSGLNIGAGLPMQTVFPTCVYVKFKPGSVILSEALAEAEPVSAALAGSEWLRAEHIERDADREYWYKVHYVDTRGNEVEGYVHADQYVAYYVPENILSWEYIDNIESLAYTTQHDLLGTIRSRGVPLSLVKGGILKGDGLATEVSVVELKPGENEFFVKPSAINTIKIGELTPGDYIYLVSAQADYYVAFDAHTMKKLTEERIAINDPFDVYKMITCVLNGGQVNGSTEDLSVKLIHGVADLPVPSKTGSRFEGWFTESSGGEPVTDDNYLGLDKVYARWSESAPILQSIESDTGGVRLSWQALDGVNTYRVFRSDVTADGSRNWVSLGEVNGTSSLDATGTAGAEYYYTAAGLVNGTETPKDEVGLYARCFRGLVDYGPAGMDALWLLYPDGTLSFVGSGDLYEYDLEDETSEAFLSGAYPWYKHRDKITKAVFEAPIRNIPRLAFYRFSGLHTVEGVQSIAAIGDRAFAQSGIGSFIVGKDVTYIGVGAFNGCTLSSLAVDAGNPNFAVIGTALIDERQSLLHTYWGTDTSYEVPAGVTEIGHLAFAGNTVLKELTLPESVNSILTHAFLNCTGLDWIKIPSETATMAWHAVAGCRTYFDYGKDGALHIIAHVSFAMRYFEDLGFVVVPIDAPLDSANKQKLKLNNNMDHIDISVENGNEGE